MEEKLIELFSDYSEIVIDNVFDYDNELLKEIPVVKTINALLQFKNSIDEKIFIKKLLNFLNCLKDIPTSKKSEMIWKIENSNVYQHNVGEKLLEILNRIDSDIKPEMIGNLFASYILEQISYSHFLRLSYVVEKSFSQDLRIILENNEDGNLYTEEANFLMSDDLFAVGIGTFDFGDENTKTGLERNSIATITDLGKQLLKYGTK